VVETAERMQEAVDEAGRAVMAGMRRSDGREAGRAKVATRASEATASRRAIRFIENLPFGNWYDD
jgi:hypothetical protein